MTAPTCPTCRALARLTDGKEIYPHRSDLATKLIWKCDVCGAYVGCHPGTNNPLGTPAGRELREARMKLHHGMIDPLWKEAWRDIAYVEDRPASGSKGADQKIGAIQRCARKRVYEYLADKLMLGPDECHTGLFDLATCRRAWAALRGVTYSEIRAWARERGALHDAHRSPHHPYDPPARPRAGAPGHRHVGAARP